MSTSSSEIRAPTPTEYKGVVFRSKSEAIFAHNLTLSGFGWEYEPKRVARCGWKADFLTCSHGTFKGVPKVWINVLEYKPSEPTQSYLASIRSATFYVRETFYMTPVIVAYGSAFEPQKQRGIFVYDIHRDEWDHTIDPTGSKIMFFKNLDAAKNHRFDLKSA